MLISKLKCVLCAAMIFSIFPACVTEADNQTPDVSQIHSGEKLPFRVEIEKTNFELPQGIHSGVFATHKGRWLLLAGRTNGMHSFANNDNNFPSQQQNSWVFVIDPHNQKTYKRSLDSYQAGLTQGQIDTLSVTSPQFYQEGSTLYITGGYGIDTSTYQFDTKDVLTAINVPGLMHWAMEPDNSDSQNTAAKYIRQTSNPIFKVTGGYMDRIGDHDTLLVFGQNFQGFYQTESNGSYTQQVRRFRIIDDGVHLDVQTKNAIPENPDPNFRRRDLNVVPAIKWEGGKPNPYLIAFSGVFTLTGGAWTVPVTISSLGFPSMENPENYGTFKQGMNSYVCAALGLFSKKHKDSYTIFLGGISYGYFSGNTFTTDSELPFTNQVTVVKRNHHGIFKQYIVDAEYPFIQATGANEGNPLLFGAGAQFIPMNGCDHYGNGVVKLDKIKRSKIVGYVVGGIQSSVPNTETRYDSQASAYVFKISLKPKKCR